MRTTSSSSSSSSFGRAEAGTVNSHSQSLSRSWQHLDCKHYDDKVRVFMVLRLFEFRAQCFQRKICEQHL